MTIDRAVLRGFPLPAVVLAGAAVVLSVLAVLAVVVVARTGDAIMAAHTVLAVLDYLSLPLITTLVPFPTDVALPIPSM